MLDRSFLEKDRYSVADVVTLMAFLRSPEGCPWDKKQTHETLRKNLIEEAYEGVDAIDSGDPERIADELGDILMQVVFHAEIGEANGTFSLDDVTTGLCKKLIRRHTHVFGDDVSNDAGAALQTWEKNKKIEKGQAREADVLHDVPRSHPALMRAYKVQKKAAHVGFDWPAADGAKAKILEELAEVVEATAETKEEELGDLLFAVVNYVRLLGFEPEVALNRSTEKFIERFTAMETAALNDGHALTSLDLAALDRYWEDVKHKGEQDAH